MSEIRTFFRFCPACRRRFHIKLVDKKLVDERKEKAEIKEAARSSPGSGYGKYSVIAPIVVEENVPITIDIKEFQYTYKCKHCGHSWSELRMEETNA